MENNINNTSFRANITTLTKIKNKSAFVEVNKLFKEGTEKNAKDVLYITESPHGESILQLAPKKDNKYNNQYNADIALININKQIESMSAAEFAKKLVSIFEALKSHEETAEVIKNLKAEILRAKFLLKTNSRISQAWASEGKTQISKRYDVLAAKNMERIEDLTKKVKLCINNFNENIEKLSTKYKELIQLQF